jgi:hypothetical protein
MQSYIVISDANAPLMLFYIAYFQHIDHADVVCVPNT